MNKCEFCGKSYVYGGGASSEPNCNCWVENREKTKQKDNLIEPIAKLEGKKAKRIYYGRDGECMQEAKTSDNYTKDIIFTNTYHGEHDIIWFVVFENGKEVSRHNAKFIETIEWES